MEGQPSASTDILQTSILYSTWLKSWEGVILAGNQWILIECNPSTWNSFELELVLDGYWQAYDFAGAVTREQVVQSLGHNYSEDVRGALIEMKSLPLWLFDLEYVDGRDLLRQPFSAHVPRQLTWSTEFLMLVGASCQSWFCIAPLTILRGMAVS
jgi:hypothetical protein